MTKYLNDDCVFCLKLQTGDIDQWYSMIVARFEPLNPVTLGHMLFIPTWHAEHSDVRDEAVAFAMKYAAVYASEQGQDFNLITSSGPSATQTIPHVHVHYVPRTEMDGLQLPWTGQVKE